MSAWINQTPDSSSLPPVVRGEGVYLYDKSGKRYIDGSSGPALFSLGHSHRDVLAAVHRQFDALEYGFTMDFSTEVVEALSERLVRHMGAHFGGVFYVSSGSEATETSLKAALQYHVANSQPSRTRFISRRFSWHGATLGALSVSGNMGRRRYFAHAVPESIFVSPAHAYRPPLGIKPEEIPAFAARELEQAILTHGAEKIAGFIFEPVVGGSLGVSPAPAGYAKAMRAVCDKYGVLMIADEVMCGVGRCGAWRALAHDGVWPDIMQVAKGLSGGYMPLGAVLLSKPVLERIRSAHGNLETSRTYSGHSAACAAALAVLDVLERDGLVDKVAKDDAYLRARLDEALGQIAEVGDVRGRGFFYGVEYVKDRETKEPFPAEALFNRKLKARCIENGLLIYPGGGIADGRRGDYAIVAPPFIATHAEIDEIADKLARASKQALADVRQ
ncbi:MAG: aspartate aminotransferase family protein [Alphaproteobacteria bacterium]|nr:aspartate aminotransferase family protein [Alphaproteobacteria bacterium]